MLIMSFKIFEQSTQAVIVPIPSDALYCNMNDDDLSIDLLQNLHSICLDFLLKNLNIILIHL